MVFLEQLNQVCTQYFEIIKQDPQHQLRPAQRLKFYSNLGNQNDVEVNRFLQHLQVLVAQHVLPIWERTVDAEYYDLPGQLLALSEDILEGKVKRESRIVGLIADKSYHLFGNLEYDDYPATTLSAGEAAYTALTNFQAGIVYKNKQIKEDATDEDLRDEMGLDAIGSAILAYAAICKDNYPTGDLEPNKCLEFWGWWISEAIPQAWQLAHQTS